LRLCPSCSAAPPQDSEFCNKCGAPLDGARSAATKTLASQVPADMVEALADFALSNAERFPNQSASWPPVQISVAETYVRRKIRLERVPALVEKGLEQVSALPFNRICDVDQEC
jgi:hypothetical protein